MSSVDSKLYEYAVQEALRMRDGHNPILPQVIASDPLFANAGITEKKIYDMIGDYPIHIDQKILY